MISDINEFCKFFKVHVPVHSEQEYYFEQLKKSNEYFWLTDAILSFQEWEKELQEKNLKIGEEKRKYLELLISVLKTSRVYNLSLVEDKNERESFFDLRKENLNRHWFSIDLKSANFTLFKFLDSENELPSSWDELLKLHNIPNVLHKSKSFRQVVFGNIKPKQTQKLIFSKLTSQIKSRIDTELQCQKNCIYLSADEMIYSFESEKEARYFEYNFPWQVENELNIRLNFSTFFPYKIPGKEFYYANVITRAPERLKQFKKLIGVPGNQFYFYFKKFVLNQEVEERDLFFQQDGQLAKWVF